MRKLVGIIACVLFAALVCSAQTFTDTSQKQHYNKLGLKSLCDTIDANNALIEAGTVVQTKVLLENGEEIKNATDGDVVVEYDDDATTLAQFIIDSINNATNLADNDVIEIIARADDSASNDTDYVVLQAKITDVTSTTEDSQVLLKVMSAGSASTVMTVGSDASGVKAITTGSGYNMTLTAGDLFVGDDATVTGLLNIDDTALALTNGQAVTVADSFYVATPAGGTNGATATITLANPTTAGDVVTFVVASAATNKLGLADSGNLKLSAAFAGDADDSITLIAPTTSIWVEMSRSSN